MEQSKTCSVCKQIKPLTEFTRRRKTDEERIAACKPCDYARQRKWAANNRAIVNATSKRYHDKNRELVREKQRANKKANPGYFLTYVHQRNAMKLGNGIFKVTPKEFLAIKQMVCIYCKEPDKKITVDHAIPLARGGRHSIGNLVPACMSCNTSKGKKTIMEFRLYRKRLGIDGFIEQTNTARKSD